MVEGVTSGPAEPPIPDPVTPVADPAAPAVAPVAPAAAPAAPVAAPVAPATPGEPAPPGDGTVDPAAAEVAPETYTEFNLPEGMEMNVAALENFAPIAKEMGLTQEQAQQLVSMDADRQIQAQQAQQDAVDTMFDEWRDTTRADPTVGGANLDKSLAQTRVFLNKFASPALLELLDTTGVGNHVEVIRLFAAAGAAMGEDGVSPGGLTPVSKLSPEQILYPNQPV